MRHRAHAAIAVALLILVPAWACPNLLASRQPDRTIAFEGTRVAAFPAGGTASSEPTQRRDGGGAHSPLRPSHPPPVPGPAIAPGAAAHGTGMAPAGPPPAGGTAFRAPPAH